METVVPLNGMRACEMKEDGDAENDVNEERKERNPPAPPSSRISGGGGERNGGEVKERPSTSSKILR